MERTREMQLRFQCFASWRRSAASQVGKFAGGFFLAELAELAELAGLAELVGVAWKS